MFFDEDICRCGNPECPSFHECVRGGANKNYKKPGIYTMALFYNKDKECEYFIGKEMNSNVKF